MKLKPKIGILAFFFLFSTKVNAQNSFADTDFMQSPPW